MRAPPGVTNEASFQVRGRRGASPKVIEQLVRLASEGKQYRPRKIVRLKPRRERDGL